ncbi:hypothetical protein NBO_195g0001 [Nosema bombycis CQ1]|uniref:Uncharacterized protein n=1 Tax=Nosema bombycis (strain CQ1 / CVCC 102059) TaxID=578461 RepID=R0MG29_NOSB1|nr:hypothetical protein NBO_195g0001 [Nosema bombycis CQ1]|eukprot:EOB13090.1 hypothetical protein NBO_195g0001 [Nosema bombycis CQ1]
MRILKSINQSLQRENNFLKKITTKKESDFIKKNYEDEEKEIEKVLNEVINKDNQLNLRVEEYDKINIRLTNKINDQKKQWTYLLESSEDTNQQKQNLIRMIQTLSKENDRLQNEIEKNNYKGKDVIKDKGNYGKDVI